MRSGWFTPTEAAVVAAFYGLFVGIVIYRSLRWRDVVDALAEAAEISAVILLVVALASVFAYASSTLGTFDHLAKTLVGTGTSEVVVLLGITLLLLIAGMFLDAISIYFIFLPLLIPHRPAFQLEPGVVRHHHHHEPRHRPVSSAAGCEPDSDLPHGRRVDGIHHSVGDLDGDCDDRHHAAGDLRAGNRAVAAACAGVFGLTKTHRIEFQNFSSRYYEIGYGVFSSRA